jgi:hypothetical protein
MIFRRKKNRHSVFATFENLDRRRLMSWRKYAWTGLVVLLTAVIIYGVFFSSFAKVKDIKINGANLVPPARISVVANLILQEKFFNFLPKNSFILLPVKNLEDSILAAFPDIESVEVIKNSWGKIEISMKERQAAAILCQSKIRPAPESSVSVLPTVTGSASSSFEPRPTLPESEQCYFVDAQGIAFRTAPQISGTLLPTFYKIDGAVNLRSEAITQSVLRFADEVMKQTRGFGVEIFGFAVPESGNADLTAFTAENWSIYFDFNRPAVVQAKMLEALLNDGIKDRRADLQYVDLRISNRISYR